MHVDLRNNPGDAVWEQLLRCSLVTARVCAQAGCQKRGSEGNQELVLWNLKGLQEGEVLKKPATGAKSAKDGAKVL